MVFEELINFAIMLVSNYGIVGVFFGMLIETVVIPLPSEVVMPLAGYLASLAGLGYAGLFLMILSGTAGTVLGAIIIYYISYTAGRQFILKYGRYILVDDKKLSAAEKWFKKHGRKAILFGRMAPGIRELISIPAGLSKMKFREFLLFTFIGSIIWTSILGFIGYSLGELWVVVQNSGISNIIAVMLIVPIAVYLIFKMYMKKKKK